jgi:hypothetical protein
MYQGRRTPSRRRQVPGLNARFIGFLIFGASSVAEAGTLTTIHSFGTSPGDGTTPCAGVVIGPGEVLYGTAFGGGVDDSGTVYSLAPPATPGGSWTETILYMFSGEADGSYGTTKVGGVSNNGTVFSLVP